MIMMKLKSAKGKKFLLCLLAVFIVAASVVTRATIGGVIEQYHIPLSEWTSSMYAIQSAMISFIVWCSLFCWRFLWGSISSAEMSNRNEVLAGWQRHPAGQKRD